MRITVLAGFLACAVFFAASNSPVHAETLDFLSTTNEIAIAQPEKSAVGNLATPLKKDVVTPLELKKDEAATPVAAEVKSQPVVHEVSSEETLSSIATKYQTTWVRLFNKNEQIANPDVIAVGQKLTVPLPDEKLVERPLPEVVVAALPVEAPIAAKPAVATSKKAPAPKKASPVSVSKGAVAGNTYAPGYCTWYIKNIRPDIPNNLGNANTWVARAASQGMATGSVPRVGAIAQAKQSVHVAYVQRVNGDGTIFISEMNFNGGLFIVHTRTVPASNFLYIY